MRKLIAWFAFLLLGFAAGYLSTRENAAAPIRDTIALSWGDHSNSGPKAMYGAHVYASRLSDGQLGVYLTVYINRPDGFSAYQHVEGLIGTVPDWPAAVAQFSAIRWTPTDLLVGSGSPNDVKVARSKIENHR